MAELIGDAPCPEAEEKRARAAEQAALREQVKLRVKAALGLSDEDAVAVNEIACLDPGCPDVETVVLIMRAGHKTWAIKSQVPWLKCVMSTSSRSPRTPEASKLN